MLKNDWSRAPKAELHLHLEGALRWSTVREFHPEGGKLPDTPPWLADPRGFADFDAFRDVFLRVLRPATGTPQAVERHVHDVLCDLAAQNVRYVEPIVGPRFHMAGGLGLREVLEAMERGWRTAERETGIVARCLYGINRHYDPAVEARQCLEALEIAGPGGMGMLAGVDLQGDDRIVPGREFAGALAEARRRGLRVRVHAGELGGAAPVRHALDELGVDHLSHGIGAACDPGLVREIAARGIWMHVCPTSNVRLGAVPSYEEHPLRRLIDAGCRVTLSSDDPLLFGASIGDEYRIARERLGLSERDLAQLLTAGFEASLLEGPLKLRRMEEAARWIANPA